MKYDEVIDRIKSGNFAGKHGFDLQLLVNLIGTLGEMLRKGYTITQPQEPQYPICERCGKQINHIKTSVFNYDGTDSEHQMLLTYDKESDCVVFETTQNWTG